tara:strand:+ start:522 stop:2645 length:2124 start_codon:yes stop_codon:yes gene_type:complete
MKKIKILLGDPRHNTVGAHSNYVPIGIGYIGSNIIKQFENSENKIELKLATDPVEIFSILKDWKPDIIGISNYIWNADLSYLICEEAKKISSNTLCILGGPEFPAGTGATKITNTISDKTYDKSLNYLLKRPSVDYFAYSDGEVAFLEIVNKFIENNLSLKSLKNKNEPVKGCASVSKDGRDLLVGDYIPRIGMDGSVKNEGRDVIPSPYTIGLLDKFLNGIFIPAFETARGCPFLCTFCDQGLDQSKITTFSVKRLAEEIMYVGSKLSKIKNTTKRIAIFDSNWGIFEKDVELADHILKIMNKYDWPKDIVCLTPKSNWKNILKINDILKNRVDLGLSMQSLKVETLTDIKRKNWTTEQYLEFLKELKIRNKPTTSEMIIPLPSETEESYFDGVKFLMDNDVQTRTYTLMMLCGAELGRDKAINQFNMKSKYRILPKQFGKYCGKKVFEIEKICVETNTMNYQSYLNCRNYSFIVKLLGHPAFSPIYKLTQKMGISWYDFSKKVTEVIEDKSFKGKFKDLYNEFCRESHDELFDSQEEAKVFYSKNENYESLLKGNIGENLLAKYTAKGLLILEDILTTIFYVIRNKFNYDYNKEINSVLSSSEKWLKNLYILDAIFNDEIHKKSYKHELKIDFDFPGWLLNSEMPFDKFNKKSIYKLDYDLKKADYIRNELRNVIGKDKQRAFGRYIEHWFHGFKFFEKQFEKLS